LCSQGLPPCKRQDKESGKSWKPATLAATKSIRVLSATCLSCCFLILNVSFQFSVISLIDLFDIFVLVTHDAQNISLTVLVTNWFSLEGFKSQYSQLLESLEHAEKGRNSGVSKTFQNDPWVRC